MKNHHTKRRFLAGAGALVTAVALALSGAAAAHAADMPATSNIVITKLTTPPTGPGTAATGIAAGQTGGPVIPSGATGINGVVFAAYAVPVQDGGGATLAPGSNAWQQRIGQIDVTAAQSLVGSTPAHTFPATSGTSGGLDQGNTQWDDAPRGLYLIRELSAPDGVTPAGDFLVAVPLTDPSTGTGWLSDIHIYPKNSKVSTTKTVAENGAFPAVGSNVAWTVQADIPRNSTISKYVLEDTLDSRLTYQPTAAVSLAGAGAQSLVACTDPAGTVPANCDYVLDYTAPKLTLTFTAPGRAKLVVEWQARPATKVQLQIVTQVNASALNAANTAAASITNAAVLTVNNAQPVTGTPATVKVGDIKIDKVRAGATGTKVGGAVFSVYANENDAKNRQNPISIDGVTTWATNATTGEAVISGLFFSNFVDGVAVSDPANSRSYWINEVVAPSGYQLLAAPIKVDVTAAGVDVSPTQVQNVPTSGGFVLPLTGGMGTAILTIGGIAILAIVLLVARRRRNAEAAE